MILANLLLNHFKHVPVVFNDLTLVAFEFGLVERFGVSKYVKNWIKLKHYIFINITCSKIWTNAKLPKLVSRNANLPRIMPKLYLLFPND